MERLDAIKRQVDLFRELRAGVELSVAIIENLRASDPGLAKAVLDTRTSFVSLPVHVERLLARGDFIEVTVRPAARGGALRDPAALDRALHEAGVEATRPPLPRPDGTLSFVLRLRPAAVRR